MSGASQPRPSGSTSFVQRAIDVEFQKASGVFTDSGKNTVLLSGLRVSATIEKAGEPQFNTVDIRIYGLTQPMMNDLSTLGAMVPMENQNTVNLFAGNVGSALPLVYSGLVIEGIADCSEMPNVSFRAVAKTAIAQAIQAIPPSSYPGTADVTVILAALAKQMGMTFENNGVSGVMLANPYFPGSALQQAREAANDAGINITFDDGVLAIWPYGGHRAGQAPLISPTTGLVRYPTFTKDGIDLRILYNPGIQFGTQIVGREPFRRLDVSYELSDKPKSDIYRDLLPKLNSGQVELPDLPRLGRQFCELERRFRSLCRTLEMLRSGARLVAALKTSASYAFDIFDDDRHDG